MVEASHDKQKEVNRLDTEIAQRKAEVAKLTAARDELRQKFLGV
jgi:hypothetical protein